MSRSMLGKLRFEQQKKAQKKTMAERMAETKKRIEDAKKHSKNVRTGKETRTQRLAKTAKYQGGKDTTKERSPWDSLKDFKYPKGPMTKRMERELERKRRKLQMRPGAGGKKDSLRSYKKGGSVGDSVKTYSNGGYVEGE